MAAIQIFEFGLTHFFSGAECAAVCQPRATPWVPESTDYDAP
jgi:hypothetical protein